MKTPMIEQGELEGELVFLGACILLSGYANETIIATQALPSARIKRAVRMSVAILQTAVDEVYGEE